MRSRSWVPLLGWLAATLTSIVLASVAMQPVLRTATADDGGLISADDLSGAGAADPIPLPPVPSRPSAPPAASPAPESPSPTPEETGDEEPAEEEPTDGATTTTPPRTTTPATRPTTGAATTPPAAPATKTPPARVVDGWTVTTGGDGVETYVRSFRVDGGQAVVRIRGGRVELVSATPSNGFEVAVVQDSPDNLAVYFNEQNHSFIVHAVWNVDRPFAQVSEIGN